VIAFFYPAFLWDYRYSVRRGIAQELIKHLGRFASSLPFWAHEEDRMRNFLQMRIGMSAELSLGYIDLLDTRFTAD
jgi:hypothetical protein